MINIGAYGNTSEATTSPEQLLQVLTPIGLEKYEKGQQITIQWRSDGLSPSGTVNIELMKECIDKAKEKFDDKFKED